MNGGSVASIESMNSGDCRTASADFLIRQHQDGLVGSSANKKPALGGFKVLRWIALDSKMVEAAGIEPASTSAPQTVLHT